MERCGDYVISLKGKLHLKTAERYTKRSQPDCCQCTREPNYWYLEVFSFQVTEKIILEMIPSIKIVVVLVKIEFWGDSHSSPLICLTISVRGYSLYPTLGMLSLIYFHSIYDRTRPHSHILHSSSFIVLVASPSHHIIHLLYNILITYAPYTYPFLAMIR